MNPVIGKAIDRVDGQLKVTGSARYCAEMPIPNLVHAVLVNSTIANGRIAAMVYHATGKHIRDLPITIDKLL